VLVPTDVVHFAARLDDVAVYVSKLAFTCGFAWRFWRAQSLDGQTGGRTWDLDQDGRTQCTEAFYMLR
jgi:hypothetical protein